MTQIDSRAGSYGRFGFGPLKHHDWYGCLPKNSARRFDHFVLGALAFVLMAFVPGVARAQSACATATANLISQSETITITGNAYLAAEAAARVAPPPANDNQLRAIRQAVTAANQAWIGAALAFTDIQAGKDAVCGDAQQARDRGGCGVVTPFYAGDPGPVSVSHPDLTDPSKDQFYTYFNPGDIAFDQLRNGYPVKVWDNICPANGGGRVVAVVIPPPAPVPPPPPPPPTSTPTPTSTASPTPTPSLTPTHTPTPSPPGGGADKSTLPPATIPPVGGSVSGPKGTSPAASKANTGQPGAQPKSGVPTIPDLPSQGSAVEAGLVPQPDAPAQAVPTIPDLPNQGSAVEAGLVPQPSAPAQAVPTIPNLPSAGSSAPAGSGPQPGAPTQTIPVIPNWSNAGTAAPPPATEQSCKPGHVNYANGQSVTNTMTVSSGLSCHNNYIPPGGTARVVSPPRNGTATAGGDTYGYRSNPGFRGTDSFAISREWPNGAGPGRPGRATITYNVTVQ